MRVRASTPGMEDLSRRMAERAQRARDITAPMQVVGEEIVLRTADAFRRSVGLDGAPWKPLAQSTKAARIGRGATANKRTKKGELTAAARARRAQVGRVIKPLVDSSRLANSAKQVVANATGLVWSAIHYGEPHMTGSSNGRPPKRNFSVFAKVGGKWTALPPIVAYMRQRVTRWITEGRP